MRRSLVVDPGLDKLQEFLLAMVAGDKVSVPDAAKLSGLPLQQCEAVLEALARAGLLTRQPDAYVRRRLSG